MTVKEDRNRISEKTGIVGIIVNVVLCSMKIIIGKAVNSISILSDGFNNLSDVFNALMVFVGYRLTGKPADKEHPYGHGRFEYMMSQFISLMVMYVGISLLRSSIERLIAPKEVLMNRYALVILGISILMKLGLAFWYGKMYEKSALTPLQAQKADSLADVAGTGVILAGYVLGMFTSLPVDSIIGIVVSLIIVFSGFRIFYQMTSVLLGQPADEQLFTRIEEVLKEEKQIQGYHDLRLHSYGSGNVYGSCDVEVNGEETLFAIHDFLDVLEKRIFDQTGVRITLHPDPIGNSRKLKEYGNIISEALRGFDERISYHDLHYNGKTGMYSLDVVMPYDLRMDEEKICEEIRKVMGEEEVEIKVDRE